MTIRYYFPQNMISAVKKHEDIFLSHCPHTGKQNIIFQFESIKYRAVIFCEDFELVIVFEGVATD